MTPKETFEEAAFGFYPKVMTDPYDPSEDLNKYERDIFIAGGSWMQERMYSEEDMKQAFENGSWVTSWSDMGIEMKYDNFETWFETYKKK